jgi:hypothetical protein
MQANAHMHIHGVITMAECHAAYTALHVHGVGRQAGREEDAACRGRGRGGALLQVAAVRDDGQGAVEGLIGALQGLPEGREGVDGGRARGLGHGRQERLSDAGQRNVRPGRQPKLGHGQQSRQAPCFLRHSQDGDRIRTWLHKSHTQARRLQTNSLKGNAISSAITTCSGVPVARGRCVSLHTQAVIFVLHHERE